MAKSMKNILKGKLTVNTGKGRTEEYLVQRSCRELLKKINAFKR